MPRDRTRSRALQAEHARRGDALGWFDALYREAAGDPNAIPWADFAPNPYLVGWHRRAAAAFRDRTCLVVGCGLGDDAEYLAAQGGRVTAFDLSDTAVRWCRRRFPDSSVTYQAANLLAPPSEWTRHFDFIFEANTLQALPAELRGNAIDRIVSFCAPGGVLLVVCRGRGRHEIVDGPPWPLVRDELDGFTRAGLRQAAFEDVMDADEAAVRRFVVEYRA